jgi:hypothetical protein
VENEYSSDDIAIIVVRWLKRYFYDDDRFGSIYKQRSGVVRRKCQQNGEQLEQLTAPKRAGRYPNR